MTQSSAFRVVPVVVFVLIAAMSPAEASVTVTEFGTPSANSGPYGITMGADGNLWFAERTADNIGEISTSGVSNYEVPVTTGSGPDRITSGPDGNLWFTATDGNMIGRITTKGAVTQFPVPTAASQPGGITAGADGNLWFTETS
jgi:virginiamycin B lyase